MDSSEDKSETPPVDQVNPSRQISCDTTIPDQDPSADAEIVQVIDTDYVDDQCESFTSANTPHVIQDSSTEENVEEYDYKADIYEDEIISLSSNTPAWDIANVAKNYAMNDDCATEADNNSGRTPSLSSTNLAWTNQGSSAEDDVEEDRGMVAVEEHVARNNNSGKVDQVIEQDVLSTSCSYSPDCDDVDIVNEGSRNRNVLFHNDGENVDDKIFHDSDEFTDGEVNYLGSACSSPCESVFSNVDQSVSADSNTSPEERIGPISANSIEDDENVLYSDHKQIPHNAYTSEQATQRFHFRSSSSTKFIFPNVETESIDFSPHIPNQGSYVSRSTVASNDYEMVTVKFLMNNGEVYTKAYQIYVNTYEMRSNLSRIFKIPIEYITLMKGGELLEDGLPLAGLGIEPCGTIELKVHSKDPSLNPIMSNYKFEDAPVAVPDVINVTIRLDKGNFKEVVVEIWNQAIAKPWIGGYRDRRTCLEYHHAFSQTPPRRVTSQGTIERVTQTTMFRSKKQSTTVDHESQVTYTQTYIPCIGDKIISAKKYVTFADICFEEQYDLKHVITMQRYLRGWLTRKMMIRVTEEYKRRVEQDAKRNVKMVEVKARKEYPRTRADFETMYNCVERWRLAEVNRITEQKTEAPRKAELCFVLEKEIVLLNSIEKHRMKLRDEKNVKKELDFIKKSSKPIQWRDKNGHLLSMDTVRTQRIREMGELYLSLCNEEVSIEDRVNLLISLKHALKSYNSRSDPKIAELTRLMVRECDCLVRGLQRNELDMLRNRLRKLFLEFMKDLNNDPETTKYNRTANATSKDTLTMSNFKCKSCNQVKAELCFPKVTVPKAMRTCKSCSWLENIARGRSDLGPYRKIVHSVRSDEEARGVASSLALIMQDEDFYFLINNVWHAQSAISESRAMDQLMLPRWDVNQDWSPWNCILLNEDETKEHVLLENMNNVYEAPFVTQVKAKHQLARSHFRLLAKTDPTDIKEGVMSGDAKTTPANTKDLVPSQLEASQ